MKSASAKAYLSKNALAAYSQQRQERIAKKSQMSSQLPQQEEKIQPKGFKEDVQMEQQQVMQQPQMMQMQMNQMQLAEEKEERYNSCDEVDSDELDGDLNLSGEEEEEAQVFRAQNKAAKSKMRARPARVFRQEIDTNVFKIDFATLKDHAEIATGDPEFCSKCKAIFNFHSKIDVKSQIGKDDQQVWVCEFCNTANEISIEDEEKPQSAAVNYIVEAAAQIQDKNVMGNKEVSVIFCMDVSGSMCVSQPIKGKFNLKGDKTDKLKEFKKFGDGSDQFLQGERNLTYVSRLQCLQAAIEQQIIDMGNGAPDRKIGLVTFNNEVSVIGDGTADPVTIAGDKLDDYDFLIKNGVEQGVQRMKNKIGKTQKELVKRLMGIEETGPTALGPAVATTIAMAGESGAGSQVVICTDGLANIGLGAFDEANTPEQLAKVEEFYERVGEYAKNKGLTINIVSIIGDECNLDSLSKLAELTGGNVERVDPIQLTSNFANILSQPIIASNVVAKIKLHKGLQFRNENKDLMSEDCSLLVRDLGNVTEDTEITFEYGLKKVSELLEMEDIDLTEIKNFPFQTQIEYKAIDGSKCIRVITDLKPISTERNELEQKADFNILGQHAIQQSANIARMGDHRQAQAYAKGWGRKMRMQANTTEQVQAQSEFVNNFKGLYNEIGQQDQLEQVMEQEEAKMDGMSNNVGGGGGGPFGSVSKKQGKKAKMSDNLSKNLFAAKKFGKKK